MDVVEVSPSALQIGVFVLCASIIIQIVGGVFYIVNACRRKPSIDETLRRDYVRRTEFEKLAADCRDDFRRIDSDIKSQRAYPSSSTARRLPRRICRSGRAASTQSGFRADTVELFIKWVDDEQAKQIALSSEDKNVKMEKLLELMYGDAAR